MLSEEINLKELLVKAQSGMDEDKIHVKKYRDAIYIGHLNEDGKRTNKGIMIYANGRRYEGEWFSDVRSGRGFELHPN